MRHRRGILLLAPLVAMIGCTALAADAPQPAPATKPKMAQVHGSTTSALAKPDDWFKSDEGRKFTDIVASWQNPNGGWWKEYDAALLRPPSLPGGANDAAPGDTEDVWRHTSTFDNNATYTELRLLAKAQRITDNPRYRDAFNKGLGFIFASQYPNGGWPQRFPLEDNYGRNITFNDGAMIGVMMLLDDVVDQKPDFKFVSDADRARAKQAFDRGIQCILGCQVKNKDGHLTAWCQQHDPVTLAPTSARKYELPSLTPSESTGIVVLLMSLDHPDQRVKDSISSAIAWFGQVKITGKKVTLVTGDQYETGRDRIVIDDPAAPPIWARFYDLDTNQPFFCSRDGIPHSAISEISWERRNHYAWYGSWPQKVLAAYPKWQKRVGG